VPEPSCCATAFVVTLIHASRFPKVLNSISMLWPLQRRFEAIDQDPIILECWGPPSRNYPQPFTPMHCVCTVYSLPVHCSCTARALPCTVHALPIHCSFTAHPLPCTAYFCLLTAHSQLIHCPDTCPFTAHSPVYSLPIHCSLAAHSLPHSHALTIHCSLCPFTAYSVFSLPIHCPCTAYSCLFTVHSLLIHCPFTAHSLPIPVYFTAHSLLVHCPFTCLFTQ
jgi:hypothetical protein